MPQQRSKQNRILVIGIGNEYRSDDAAGLVVARRLREWGPGTVSVSEKNGDGAALLEAWRGADAVILVDAVRSGATPGTIHRIDAHVNPIPSRFFHRSTHAFGVVEAVEMARALGQLPRIFIVLGIEGKNFEPGVGLSAEVEQAIHKAVERVRRQVKTILKAPGHPA